VPLASARASHLLVPWALLVGAACSSGGGGGTTEPPDTTGDPTPVYYTPAEFVMGADLSYVNQILDRGGVYRDSGVVKDPYAIFSDRGANTVRLRLWHTPDWVRTDVYDDPAVPLYSGLDDVAEAIETAKQRGLEVLLDLHYSDIWADPGRQDVPAAWRGITDLAVLEDSVYQYTRNTLEHLDGLGLLPEAVQIGNETNCGMLSTGTEPGFPELDVCQAGQWQSQGTVINAGIRAVRDVSPAIRVALHVAQPEHVSWWFGNITTAGGVTDFDIVGFSYYSRWSSESLGGISDRVSAFRRAYGRDVMILETAYPWTLQNADGYGNIFGPGSLVIGYPATPEGQRSYLIRLVQEVVAGGGRGVFYWEPAWITSGLKDLWGTGSAWDNNTFFRSDGRVHEGIGFYTHPYNGLAD
jgi:arabinogalactan endo-1,4-beta-galactosidase